MIFALLTLLSALLLASVAGWFSIVGFMTIYAGQPYYALIMGAVTEIGKLVTTSWLYRNWQFASWKLKLPLIYFTIALMTATSIGVFGFLSKAHLEQGSSTIDNSAKIEQLNFQIQREKSLIADSEKVIEQLDATVNSFLGKDRVDRSLAVRKSQAPQRQQLRNDIAESQKRIDQLNNEKFALESEVRKMQLEVGPIRYIAELFYGVEENSTKNIEAAVKMFTLLLVSTLDPLAVILLIAANHTLLRLKHEKEKNVSSSNAEHTNTNKEEDTVVEENVQTSSSNSENNVNTLEVFTGEHTKKEISPEIHEKISDKIDEKEENVLQEKQNADSDAIAKFSISPIKEKTVVLPIVRTPSPTAVIKQDNLTTVSEVVESPKTFVDINASNHSILKDVVVDHFVPKKINDNINSSPAPQKNISNVVKEMPKNGPTYLSWIDEFKGQKNG